MEPNLMESRWVSLTVFYCVGDGKDGVVQGKKWTTKDKEVLTRLRSAYHEIARRGGMVAGTMTTNKVAITLENGQEWWLYLFDEHLASLQGVPNRRPTYHLEINPNFVESLRAEILRETGETAYFYYPYEVRIK